MFLKNKCNKIINRNIYFMPIAGIITLSCIAVPIGIIILSLIINSIIKAFKKKNSDNPPQNNNNKQIPNVYKDNNQIDIEKEKTNNKNYQLQRENRILNLTDSKQKQKNLKSK